MKRTLYFVLLFILVLSIGSVAQGQATRTWVSGVGDDVNPCSRTAPCKTYAGAISKTAAGGIISTLDPGGFGAVTITKSITIDGTGQIGSVLGAGTNGVVINAGAADVVVLRGLEIHGAGSGFDGIRVLRASEVYVEECRIQNFTSDGMEVLPSQVGDNVKVVVRNSEIRNNTGRGIIVNPSLSSAVVRLVVDNSLVSGNTSHGIQVGNANTSVTILDSAVTHNGNAGLQVENTTATGFATGSIFSYNGTGIISGVAGLTPVVRISGCTISGNTVNGVSGSGTIVGLTNNMVFGNTGDNTISSSVVGQ